MPKKKLETKKKAKAPVQGKGGSQAKAKKRKRPFVSTRFRDFICGHVYHIFQRGNHGRSVFRTDKERFKYLENLSLFALRYSVKIHNFCLMPTHVHLVLEQRLKNGISNMMRDLQAGHARAHNRSLNTFGNLWTQHFGCKHVKNDAYYQTLMWYVENNPVKTSSCERAEDYKWSGAHVHAAGGSVTHRFMGRNITISLYMKKWEAVCNTPEWKKRLNAGDVPTKMADVVEDIELILDGEARQQQGRQERVKQLNEKQQKAREKKELRRRFGAGKALQMEAEERKKAAGKADSKSGPRSMRAG